MHFLRGILFLPILFHLNGYSTDSTITHQHIQLKIEPETGQLECTVKFTNLKGNSFELNSDMHISALQIDKKKESFNIEKKENNISEISFGNTNYTTLEIHYSGKINPGSYPKVISTVNKIESGFIEIAGYVRWFPWPESGYFTFTLDIELPGNYIAMTNGELISEKEGVSKWNSFGGTSDIAIVAAPGLKKKSFIKEDLTIEMIFDRLNQEYIDSMQSNLFRSMYLFKEKFGSPDMTDLIRIAYSPRPGWAYVREPLIILSEDQAMEQRLQNGAIRDFKLLSHELAHYWWKYANSSTPDDWINEGLAEFSSILAVEDVFGKEAAKLFFDEHKTRSSVSRTETCIAETEHDSPDREINRYSKPVVLFEKARQVYGDDTLHQFLSELYRNFNENGSATTRSFLEVAEKSLGHDARLFFEDALYAKAKTKSENDSVIPCSMIADDVKGKWSGILSQAGQQFTVELVIACENELIKTSLNSPDQAVFGIPVSGTVFTNESLSLIIPSASASLEGTFILPDKKMIRGEWKQFGNSYLLELAKVE